MLQFKNICNHIDSLQILQNIVCHVVSPACLLVLIEMAKLTITYACFSKYHRNTMTVSCL